MLNYMQLKSQTYNLISLFHSCIALCFFLLHCFIPFLFCAPCSDQNSNVPPNEGSISYNKYIVSAVSSRSMGIKIVKVAYCTGIIGLVANNSCDPVVFVKRKRNHSLGMDPGRTVCHCPSWPRPCEYNNNKREDHGCVFGQSVKATSNPYCQLDCVTQIVSLTAHFLGEKI